MSREYEFFILDTNVLLKSPEFIRSFAPRHEHKINYLAIPLPVFSQIDDMTHSQNYDRRRSAVDARRAIHEVMRGDLVETTVEGKDAKPLTVEGFRISEGYYLTFLRSQLDTLIRTEPARTISSDHVDNILLTLCDYLRTREGLKATIITYDTGVHVLGKAYRIPVEEWEDLKGGYDDRVDDIYKGWQSRTYSSTDFDEVRRMLGQGVGPQELGLEQIHPNEFFIAYLENTGKSAEPLDYTTAYFDARKGRFNCFTLNSKITFNGAQQFESRTNVLPKNALQACYMYACRSQQMPIVFALGAAGTSKTFTAVDAIVDQVLLQYRDKNVRKEHRRAFPYVKAMLCRPMVATTDSPGHKVEMDLGALPGGIEEKAGPWLAPIFDNLRPLLESQGFPEAITKHMYDTGKLEVLIAQAVRGRSLSDTFLFVDEAQNLYPNMLINIGERLGHKSKLVIAGDPNQSDLPGNDGPSSSIVIASNRFRHHQLAATIYFPEEFNVRGAISRAFSETLRPHST